MDSAAKWMAARTEFETPWVRKEFELDDFESAVIRICGLVFFELYVNGIRVGEDYFKPAWTDYGYRDLTNLLYPVSNSFGYRRYFLEYDIRKLLKRGGNVLAILLGNGWYRQNRRNIEGNLWYGDRLKLWFDLEIVADGKTRHIVSDESLTHGPSHIVCSNIYYGEVHDYSRCASPSCPDGCLSDFVPMERSEESGFVFEKQPCSCDAVVRTIKPEEIARIGGWRIFDVKENVTGWAALCGARGSVKVRYAEEINADGSLNFGSAGGTEQISCDEYLHARPELTLRPVFHWNAFRYFMVEGAFEQVVCEVVHQKVPVVAQWKSSDERLNWLFETYVRTQLNNFHCGVPSDCPHRERLGYTGDGWLTAQCAMLLLDVRDFYKKWIRDIFDCQDPVTGHVLHTAPFYGGGGGPGGWGGAIVWMPYFYYAAYRDEGFLREAFPHIRKYLACMESFCLNGLVVKEIEGGWCLGDWCTPEAVRLPEAFVNTFFYIRLMMLADEIADILSEPRLYTDRIAACTDAWIDAFYSREARTFCGGEQGADIFACELGLSALVSFEDTVSRYAQSRRFDTGIFGTYFLIKQLVERGQAEVAFDLLTSEEYPSFGFMRKNGASTFWESWDGGMSHDHPMFGGCVYYLLQASLGVKCDVKTGRLVIEPMLTHKMDALEGTVQTPYGKVTVKFESAAGQTGIEVLLPDHTEAELILNGKTVVLTQPRSFFHYSLNTAEKKE